MHFVLSGAIGIGAVIAVGCVLKGIFLLLEVTQGELGRWIGYGCAAFVAYLVGNGIVELRKSRGR